MGEGRAAIVLERAEDRVGIDLVAGSSQETATVVTAKVVAVGSDRCSITNDICSRATGFKNSISNLDRAGGIDTAALLGGGVTADRAIGDNTAAVDATPVTEVSRIAADSAVANGNR